MWSNYVNRSLNCRKFCCLYSLGWLGMPCKSLSRSEATTLVSQMASSIVAWPKEFKDRSLTPILGCAPECNTRFIMVEMQPPSDEHDSWGTKSVLFVSSSISPSVFGSSDKAGLASSHKESFKSEWLSARVGVSSLKLPQCGNWSAHIVDNDSPRFF